MNFEATRARALEKLNYYRDSYRGMSAERPALKNARAGEEQPGLEVELHLLYRKIFRI